jgi:hypothetical protein
LSSLSAMIHRNPLRGSAIIQMATRALIRE